MEASQLTEPVRVVCVGDIHAMDRAPRNATETYMDDIIDMLMWVADYAKPINAVVVWAGDIFHHKTPSKTSHALVLRMIKVVRYHEESGVELYAVTGNHDISEDVLASIEEKQPLGVLYESGLMELKGWHKTLPIYGVPWRSDWTSRPEASYEAFAMWRSALGIEEDTHPALMSTPALAVTHAPIYPPKEAENILWELVPTRGDNGLSAAMGGVGSLYYGHIHEDHGIFEVEGVTYANMGAISRGSLTEYNVNRQIKVAVWEDGVFTEVVVPHKPAEEVLRVAEVAAEKADKLSLDQFLSEVGQTQLEVSTAASVIEYIRSRDDLDDRVRTAAVQVIEDVS